MQFINYLGQDAYTNIAMDSWLLYHLKPTEPVFALWQNKRAVIVGRNQNTFAEVNQDYIDSHDVQVVRRVSENNTHGLIIPFVKQNVKRNALRLQLLYYVIFTSKYCEVVQFIMMKETSVSHFLFLSKILALSTLKNLFNRCMKHSMLLESKLKSLDAMTLKLRVKRFREMPNAMLEVI